MKNNRLRGIAILIIALLVAGGLSYYEWIHIRPGQSEIVGQAESDDMAPLGDKPLMPPASLTEEKPADTAAPAAATPAPADQEQAPTADATAAAPAAEAPAAAAPSAATTAAAPAADATAAAPTAAAPAAEAPAPAAGTPAPTDQAQAPAGNQMAPVPTAEAPAAVAAAPAAEAPAAAAGTPPASGEQQVATAEPSPATAAPTAPTTATPDAPTMAGPNAPAMSGPTAGLPSFDVVRVEPTGDTVVAGQADPNSKVEVLDGPAVVATATANDQGDWAMPLDNALKPGTHDLAIRTTSKDGAISTLSDQRVAVQVPEPGAKDVLVVLNSPNNPSRVLELPKGEAPAAGTGNQVAAAEPPLASATPSTPEAPKTGGEVANLEQPQSGTVAPAPAAGPTAPAPAAAAPAGPATAAPASSAAAPAEKPAVPATAEAQPPAEKPAAPATAEAQPPAAAAPPAPEVAVSAVEADTAGTLYVAGTATTKEPVRVYLNDQPLGEAKPSPSGTWLMEVHHEVAPGTYHVRADQVSASDGSVIARAEVPFDRSIDVANLKASGNTGAGNGAGAAASGKLPEVQTVIIKRGDNLWSIARDTWGRGITWSTLYQVNKDQIRNPHWIYPGQVFIMPVTPNVAKN